MIRSATIAVGLLCSLAVSPAHAQSTEDWPLEQVLLKGGKEYRGLLLERTERQTEFAEIVRPRGKAMFAIIHAFSRGDVTSYQQLPPEERVRLQERFATLRNRALIEAGRMEAVHLGSAERDGLDYLLYDGPWFTMLSTADEPTTRRSIVRIEQTFRGYRQMLPPRVQQVSSFQIYLYGSTAEYRAQLTRWRVEIEHPAFYSPERNVIVAGTDLDRFGVELAASLEENERTRKEIRTLKSSHEQTLLQVASDMRKNGFGPDDIDTEIRARRSAWEQQQAKLEKEIDQAKRNNAAKFDEVARAMFRRLNHEAFHAYLENYVFSHGRYALPRWLNEGLAQVFEHAQLDADTLRIDAPARDLLPKLQADLKKQPLALADLLKDDESLVAAHRNNDAARRRYLYAWGLAYYLAFQKSGLGTKEFEAYVAKSERPDDRSTPISRFERLVGMPLAEFDQHWRKEMLQLR